MSIEDLKDEVEEIKEKLEAKQDKIVGKLDREKEWLKENSKRAAIYFGIGFTTCYILGSVFGIG